MEEEQRKVEQRKEANKLLAKDPFRFFVKPGMTSTVIIVDDEPTFFRSEHCLKHPTTHRYTLFLPCIDEHANCPVCEVSEKPAYFALYLTVIDCTPYTTSAGVEVDWSKKLMVVKVGQQKKITRLLEAHGSLRGMVLECTRDTDRDASIGNDINFIEFASEDELLGYETSYEDKDGEVHDVIGHEAYDYEKIMPDLTESQLVTMAAGGERQERPTRNARDGSRGSSRESEEPATRRAPRAPHREQPEPEPAASTRRAPRRPSQEEEAPPSRGSRAASRQPAEAPSRSVRGARAPRPSEEREEQPPQRAAVRRPAARNPLPDADAPSRPAGGVAARRAQLRQGR